MPNRMEGERACDRRQISAVPNPEDTGVRRDLAQTGSSRSVLSTVPRETASPFPIVRMESWSSAVVALVP